MAFEEKKRKKNNWIHTRRFVKRMTVFLSAMGAAFSPRNLKNAFRTVTFNRKEYLCFFLALFLIITGLTASALSLDADLVYAKKEIVENYDYHLTVSAPEEIVPDIYNALSLAVARSDAYIESFRSVEEADGSTTFFVKGTGYVMSARTVNPATGLSVRLKKDIVSHLTGDVIYRSSGYTVRTSPLYEYESVYRTPYLWSFWGLAVGWLILAAAVLVVLYLIRLDHFRFTYGIYLTCGADFPMLYGTAAGELMAVTAIVFLPGTLVGGGLSALLCARRGIAFAFSARSALVILLAPLPAVLPSVWFPMRRLAKTPPVRLLAAKDNAGLVSSPRRSFRLFGETFPGRYELYTMWRMRSYYIRLVLSAVLFAAMFLSGLYVAEMQDHKASLPSYEYIVSYAPTAGAEAETDDSGATILPRMDHETLDMIRTDADYFLDELNALPGVGYVFWDNTRAANYMQDHLLLSAGQQAPAGGAFSVPSEERRSQGYVSAVNNVSYTAVDKAWIDAIIDNDLGTFEGDPYAVLTDDRAVILTEDSYNERAYRFAPGDRVLLAEFKERHGTDPVNFEPRAVLQEQIKNCVFTYTEYTVAAVLRDMASDYNITFGVNYPAFEALTDASAARDTLRVYIESGTDYETARAAESSIRKLILPMTGWVVTPTGNYFRSTVKGARNSSGLSVTLAVLLLLLSPLVWLFSQIMFYRKRRGEFDMLYALGAPRGSVAAIHRLSGGVLSGLAFLATILLSLVCNWVVWMLVTVLLPKLHLAEAFSYDFRLSLPALGACVLASVVCGFLSTEVPYRLFGKKKYTQRRDY